MPPIRRLALACAALGLAGIAAAAGYAVGARTGGPKARDYAEARAPVVAYRSRDLGDGYVMLAGDSHAELAQPDPLSCGRRVLNAGVASAKAGDYLAFLDALRLTGRPAVAVVTLGTNHLLRKHDPAGREAGERYEADLARVVERLSALADRVIVAAVPPIAPSRDAAFDRAGIPALTKRQAAVCARLGCETVDPYLADRGADFGTARPGTTTDGVHLTDYAGAYRAIDRQLCQ